MIIKFGFLERWYERVKEMARHKNAERSLYIVSFFESFIFPIPTSVMLVPMVVAERSKAWRYAFWCTIASVLGGIVGYLIGWFAYEAIALPILEKLGKTDKIAGFEVMVDKWGAMAVFGAGLTPFPYKVVTILGGMLKLNFLVFFVASIVSRGLQFYFVSGIAWKFGEQAEAIIKKHFAKFTFGFVALIIIGWLAWKYFHHS